MSLFLERFEAARTERLASEHGTKIPEFTIGDLMSAIWSVDNEDDARAFFDSYVEYLNGRPDLEQPAEVVARSNIGWMYGEGMAPERIEMWRRATGSLHPIFGGAMPSTPAEAFQAGLDAAQQER